MIRRQAIRSLASGGLLLPGILSELLADEPEKPARAENAALQSKS